MLNICIDWILFGTNCDRTVHDILLSVHPEAPPNRQSKNTEALNVEIILDEGNLDKLYQNYS